MKRQSYPVIKLTGGLDVSVDAILLVDKNSPNLRNIRFDQGLIRKGLGFSQFGTVASDGLPLDGTPMLIDSFPLASGTIHYLFTTTKWVYRYISASGLYEKKNKTATTGAISLTFVAATKKITRDSGSFVTDGFTTGSIITTDATLNPGPFTAVAVEALEIEVSETVVDEGPVTKTATGIIPFTGDADYQFGSTIILDSVGTELYVLANGKDPIQKWDGGGGTFSDLGGWSASPITARTLANFKSRLVAGFTAETGTNCPWRVRWSIAGNPEDISGTGSGFVDIAETPDWVVALVPLKGKLYIFKEKSIWELVYVGGTTVFTPELRVEGVGTYSPHSIASLGEEVVFYGNDNIYIYDGLNLTPVGKNIYPLLYDTEKRIVSSAKANRFPGIYIEELKKYALCVATLGEVPDLLLEYDFRERSWTLRDKSILAFGTYSTPSGTTWESLSGTWSAQTWIWMEKELLASAPTTLIADPSSYIWEDTRKTKSTDYMVFETKDWMFQHGERIVEFRIEAKGGPFTLSYSVDQGLTWPASKTFSASTDWTEYVWYVNFTCQTARLRVESVAEDLSIKWIEPWYIPRVRSKSLTTS